MDTKASKLSKSRTPLKFQNILLSPLVSFSSNKLLDSERCNTIVRKSSQSPFSLTCAPTVSMKLMIEEEYNDDLEASLWEHGMTGFVSKDKNSISFCKVVENKENINVKEPSPRLTLRAAFAKSQASGVKAVTIPGVQDDRKPQKTLSFGTDIGASPPQQKIIHSKEESSCQPLTLLQGKSIESPSYQDPPVRSVDYTIHYSCGTKRTKKLKTIRYSTTIDTPAVVKSEGIFITPGSNVSSSLLEDESPENDFIFNNNNMTQETSSSSTLSIMSYKKQIKPPPKSHRLIFCKCKSSQCLKLYCDCFSTSMYCNPERCICKECRNLPKYNDERVMAINKVLSRNKNAFLKPKLSKGLSRELNAQSSSSSNILVVSCACKKSQCIKLYCDCFNSNKVCGRSCRCENCLNYEGCNNKKSLEAQKVHWYQSAAELSDDGDEHYQSNRRRLNDNDYYIRLKSHSYRNKRGKTV